MLRKKPLFSAIMLVVILGSIIGVVKITELPDLNTASSEAASSTENVVLITLNSMRADHMPCYGYHRNTTPNICEQARKGYLVENMYSSSTWTLPAQWSIHSGRFPLAHGITNPEQDIENFPTMAEQFQNAGYKTGAFVGSIGKDAGSSTGTLQLNSKYGFDRGFDTYHEEGRYLKHTVPAAKKWISKNNDREFFLFLQSYNLHLPANEPVHNDTFDPRYNGTLHEITVRNPGARVTQNKSGTFLTDGNTTLEFTKRDLHHLNAEYDGNLKHVDRQLGELFTFLENKELMENTTLIITSAHGIGLDERTRLGPNVLDLEEVSHVPLVIRNTSPPSKEEGFFQLIDLMPSILQESNIEPPKTQGINIFEERRSNVYVNNELFNTGIWHEKEGYRIRIHRNKSSLTHSPISLPEEERDRKRQELRNRWGLRREENMLFGSSY